MGLHPSIRKDFRVHARRERELDSVFFGRDPRDLIMRRTTSSGTSSAFQNTRFSSCGSV
ncbi:hypothetical protein PAXRUDRAFT_827041 [Paxillus rubicundulus Ve08.2h10]|uniref:Uncharacterized protein n=1 Tax=Paxillus rubicundulus Ve08.2h10 TaxID=930991 RepID=A0A0D0E932_9AGAM|nr:hypothetical protein PAXRUDRAFT_827041 [Paxillus rubicundulus Ve08.2h10]